MNTAKQLEILTAAWKEAKVKEQEATSARLSIEAAIYELVQNELKESGVNNFIGGLQITTKLNEVWDQKRLSEILRTHEFAIFPFKVEWKKDPAAFKVIKDKYVDDYEFLLSALTVKPAKPTFSIKEKLTEAA